MVALTKTLGLVPLARPGTRLVQPSLQQCQINTPDDVVRFAWEQIEALRDDVDTVLDLGAGDGRFASHGDFRRYIGYEIDPGRVARIPRRGAQVVYGDALDAEGTFDVVVGNPPYIRNQDLTPKWRRKAVELIERESGSQIDLRANLYVYFMWLALLRTKSDGLVAQIVPSDWLVRPSASRVREFIADKGWSVSTFVFDDARMFFAGVKTTLTLTIVDKRSRAPWKFFAVTDDLQVVPASRRKGLEQALRPFPTQRHRADGVYAGRGLSPGSQAVFTLTEAERKAAGISLTSVVPCVTSLRGLPRGLASLSEAAFKKHFVDAGRRCWLLRTSEPHVARPVRAWLAKAPKDVWTNGTCGKREPWYAFTLPESPELLYSSGFSVAPLFLVNTIGAKAVGAVHGIFGAPNPSALAKSLRTINYAEARFRHAREFMKIEVSEMNDLLQRMP